MVAVGWQDRKATKHAHFRWSIRRSVATTAAPRLQRSRLAARRTGGRPLQQQSQLFVGPPDDSGCHTQTTAVVVSTHLITLAVFWNRSRKCQGTQYGKITDTKMSQPFFFTAKSIGDLLALTPKDSKIFQVSGDRMALAVSMALPTLVFTETRRMPKWMDTGGKCGKWKHVETCGN